MTIDVSNNNPRIEYSVAQGVTQTVFAVPFDYFEDSDVTIYVDGVAKVLGTDYTMTGGDGSTGTITFVTATPPDVQQVTGATGGSTVVIVRHVALERVTDFVAGQDINRAALNTQLDTIVAQIADLDDKVDRTLHITDYEVNPGTALPSIDARKGRVIAFNSNTGAIEAGPTSNDIATIATNISTILQAPTNAANAAASASAAAASETAAAASEAAASTSETNAATSASTASTAATTATTQATAAAASATAAATSATNAATSASNAATSATSASSSATAAQSAQAGAEAAYDSFDDRYLGAKASAPTTDNDGDPLVTGALYYNTTAGQLYIWNGSAWDDAAFSASGAVTSFNTRIGAVTLNSTDVANASGLLSTNNLSDLGDAATARTNLGLGTAATTASTDYAAASHTHTLSQITNAGTAAAAATTDFATAAQGTNADTAYGWGNHASAGYLTGITGQSIKNLSDVYSTMAPTDGQVLTWDNTNSRWDAVDASGGGFTPTTVSGASQALDLSSYNFFDAGTLTADTTLSFTSVPTEASWTYTAKVQPVTTYDIGNAFYAGAFKSILNEDTVPWGMFFKPDGTKMYVAGGAGDKVYQYSLYTAWDVSTALYDIVSFSVSSQETNPRGLFFKPDGTKMYVVGTSSDTVYQYSLSTAWDVSTASYDSVSFSVASQDTSPSFVFFKPDGTKMYVGGNVGNTVYQYSLSTAWSISTASYDSVSFSITTEATGLAYVFFKPDGTKMYAQALSDYSIHQYSLSTAWDVSTASYDSISLTLGDNAPRSIVFKDDGTRLYSLGVLNDQVTQYETHTLPSITLPASVQNSQRVFDPNSRIAYTFFTTDGGTNVYIINQDGSV